MQATLEQFIESNPLVEAIEAFEARCKDITQHKIFGIVYRLQVDGEGEGPGEEANRLQKQM